MGLKLICEIASFVFCIFGTFGVLLFLMYITHTESEEDYNSKNNAAFMISLVILVYVFIILNVLYNFLKKYFINYRMRRNHVHIEGYPEYDNGNDSENENMNDLSSFSSFSDNGNHYEMNHYKITQI